MQKKKRIQFKREWQRREKEETTNYQRKKNQKLQFNVILCDKNGSEKCNLVLESLSSAHVSSFFFQDDANDKSSRV